jgi:hypothetical protein
MPNNALVAESKGRSWDRQGRQTRHERRKDLPCFRLFGVSQSSSCSVWGSGLVRKVICPPSTILLSLIVLFPTHRTIPTVPTVPRHRAPPCCQLRPPPPHQLRPPSRLNRRSRLDQINPINRRSRLNPINRRSRLNPIKQINRRSRTQRLPRPRPRPSLRPNRHPPVNPPRVRQTGEPRVTTPSAKPPRLLPSECRAGAIFSTVLTFSIT